MATFAPMEVHVPTDGQTAITIGHPYVVGASELKVYLNGVIAIIGNDYVETDNQTITFNFQLSHEDLVITQHEVYFEDKLVKVISEKGQALFQKYGTENRLKQNQEYTMEFRHGSQTLKAKFFTVMNPMYSSIKIIRADFPDFFKSIADGTIAMQIYMNGVLVDNLIQTQIDAGSMEEDSVTDFQKKQYVRYQTELDLALGIYFAITGKPSSDHKVLGALEVEKRYRLEDVKPLITELKAKLRPWEDAIKGRKLVSPLRTAVRGGSNMPYPLTTPRRVDGV